MYTHTKSLLSRKNIFYKNGETGVNVDPVEANISHAFPELTKLSLTPDEMHARAKALANLTDILNNPKKRFGSMETQANAVGTGYALDQIRDLVAFLKTQPNNPAFWNTQVASYFRGWDADGSADLNVLRGTSMSKRVLLQKLLGDTELAGKILMPRVELSKPLDRTEVEQVSRIRRFLSALESKDKKFPRGILNQADTLLKKGELEKALDILQTTVKKEVDIDINSVLTPAGLSQALRDIGDTGTAGQVMMGQVGKTISEASDTDTDIKKLGIFLDAKIKNPAFMSAKRTQAEGIYTQMLAALPYGDPDRAGLISNKTQVMSELTSQAAFMDGVSGYIRTNGSKNLGSAAKAFDDMKGLYGTLNWSDEHVKIGKEVALFLVTTVLTMGMSSILAGVAGAARVAQGVRMANIANSTRKLSQATSTFQKVRAGASIVKNTVTAKTALGVAKTTEGLIVLDNGFKRAGVFYEALKFTTFDAALRSGIFRQAGERSGFDGFEDFVKKLAMNTVMFASFMGMEKVVGKALPASLRGAKGFTIENAGKMLAFSAGDVAVMQGLHAAETGKLEWDWQAAFQALAFRAGMESATKLLPNLAKKYENRGDRAQRKISSIEKSKQNINLSDADRIIESQKLLGGKALSDVQKKAIISAHNTGTSGIGNFTQAELKAKSKILENAGFTSAERRILMENGITGKERSQEIQGLSDKKFENPKQGDTIEVAGSQWRYTSTAHGEWQKLDANKGFSGMDYVEGTKLSTKGLKTLQTKYDNEFSALRRIGDYKETRIGTSQKRIQLLKEIQLFENPIRGDIGTLGGSEYRYTANGQRWQVKDPEKTWAAMDYTEGKQFTLAELRSQYGVNEKISPIESPTPALGEPVKDSTNVIKNYPIALIKEKALIPLDRPKNPQEKTIIQAEQKAVADQLEKNIIDGEFRDITNNEPFPKNTREWSEALKKHWGKLVVVAGLIGTILLLQKCRHDAIDPDHPVVPPVEADTKTSEAAIAYCQQCSAGPRSDIDYARKSAASASITLDEKRRENISDRWSQKKEWADVVALWDQNRSFIPEDAQKAMFDVLTSHTPENIQSLQHCIGMTYTDTSGNELDDAHGQDGILGPNTTAAIHAFITKCQIK